MKPFYLILSLLALSAPALAQSVKLNPKAGAVSEEEVSMTTYPLDTAAAAVYLADIQEITIRTDDVLNLDMHTKTYQRIKVLKDGAKSVADYKIVYSKDASVGSIKVTTYNWVDGKVVKSKLEKKYIFRDKVSDNVFSVSFSAPEVRVGSVVEVSFEMTGKRWWDVPQMELQRSYPVNWVSATLEYPEFIHMNRMSRGYLTPVYTRDQTSRMLRNNVLPMVDIMQECYQLYDVPAIPREVSSNCPEQYRCAVSHEVSAVTIPGFVYKDYSLKWPDVDESIRKTELLSQCSAKGKFLEPFVSKAEDERQAIAEVRCAVLDAVKWDDYNSMIPDNIRDVIKKGSGDSASINAIVASVLGNMGYTVSPVLLRRRGKGVLANFYVRTDAFTNMILKIETPSGAVHYLDAAPDAGYIDVLKPEYLVEEARVYPLNGAPAYWDNLTRCALASSNFVVNATLQEDGHITGTIGMNAMSEASFLVRQTRESLGSDEKYAELVEKGEAFETVSFEYNAEPYAPAVGFNLEFEQEATESGEFLYVKPFLITQYRKSDFPAGERHTPVDFPVLDAMNYVYSLTIPEGYQVEQLPQPVRFRSAGFNAMASCRSGVSPDGVITLQLSYKNSSLQVMASEYENLRAFWEQLCSIFEGTIVLKKK